MFDQATLSAIFLTLKLATVSTSLLMLICIPIAWWLARFNSPAKAVIEAIFALPLILPPTVIGFYLLLAFSPNSPIGSVLASKFDIHLAFSFPGLVVGSIIYSLPFVLQPIQNGFTAVKNETLEAAATLGASSFDRFFSIAIPASKHALLTAFALGFAHTLGEFGVVLMIGGNIPNETQVISILLFNKVEAMAYGDAHNLALLLLAFSFILLFGLYRLNQGVSFKSFGRNRSK